MEVGSLSPAPDDWDELTEWWAHEVENDPGYRADVVPLLVELMDPVGGLTLDLGCGEGQVMRAIAPATVVGCDASHRLLLLASSSGPVVRCQLPDLGWLRTDAVAAAYSVLVIEHLPSVAPLFAEVGRVVEDGGTLVIVMNHPAFTPDGAGPIIDKTDGEVLWRWADYLTEGSGVEPAGAGVVTFHHRPLGSILEAASQAGWFLERLVERALGPETVAGDPLLGGQDQIPRLLGVRWRLVERVLGA